MRKIYLLIICLAMVGNNVVHGQNQVDFNELASEALRSFSRIVDSKNFELFGLAAADALKGAEPGDAIVHYGVPLDLLRRYQDGQDPNELVSEMGYATVPLVRQGTDKPAAFVLIHQSREMWSVSGLGEAPYSEGFMQLSRELDLQGEPMLVRIPAMNLAFVGTKADDILSLAQITDLEIEGMRKGGFAPAAVVFSALARQAREMEDLPR
jgi:hypothetical protein